VLRHDQGVVFDPHQTPDPFGGAPPPDVLTAHLLVANPRLADPNFVRRTVLVLDHGDHGALGVVLDHPGGVPVDEVLPQWHALATPPAELFTGGPVARNAVIGLARLRAGTAVDGEPGSTLPAGWTLLIDDAQPVGTLDLAAGPAPVADPVIGLRLFSGYAGWGPGQLEGEIDEGSWFVVPAEARDPVSADPEGLWRRVLRRQGGSLAVMSGYPLDPGAN
jgi:putative transcriptional regulator